MSNFPGLLIVFSEFSDIDVVIFGAQPIDDKSPLAILAEALEEEELPSKPPKVIASAKVNQP